MGLINFWLVLFLVCWPHVAPAVEASSACFWTPEVSSQGGTYEMSASVMQQVEEIVGSFRTKYLLPSVSVSVSVGNRIVYQKGFGFQDGVSGPNVTGNSLYRIGSLSKIFTTLLTLQMIDRGEVVSLDDNILNYEPLFTIDGTSAGYRNSSITLRQLSSHTAGLPREGPCFPVDLPHKIACNLPSSEIYSRLAKELMIFDTDVMPSYSNLGFCVLGNAMGTRLIQLYGAPDPSLCQNHQPELCAYVLAIRNRILVPLGLQDDIGFWIDGQFHSRMAVGFSDGVPIPYFDMGWLTPAGQIFASANALNQLIFNTMGWGGLPSTVISSTTASEWMMHRFANVDGSTGMANPWEMQLTSTTPSYWLREKDGEVPGYNTQILISPELQLSISVLTAAAPPTVAEPLGNQLAAPIVAELDAWTRAGDSVYPMPSNPSSFVGVYRSLLGQRVAEITVALVNTSSGPVFSIAGGPLDGFIHVLNSHMALKPSGAPGSNSTFFQLIPLRSSSGVYCPYMQDGYFFQTVQISSDYGLSIPGLYYGFVFHKTQ